MKLTIKEELTKVIPTFSVIAYTMSVENKTTPEVSDYLEKLYQSYLNKWPMSDIVTIPKIKESRDGYKKLGKDPSHTRLACEALLRRVVKGDSIYRLGDIIDIGNALSIQCMRSVCVVDLDKIKGDVVIRIGSASDEFIAINRGPLNITKIPVYCDDIGPFGTPTSDTNRTSIDNTTNNILVMIICFTENDKQNDEMLLRELYQKFTQAVNIQKIEVQNGKL